MKTYIITLSKVFPVTHPLKGQLTGFKKAKLSNDKKHTIRGNYAHWKKIVDEVNSGKAILSVREWTGRPYASKQVEICQHTKLGIQKCDVSINTSNGNVSIIIDGQEKIFAKSLIIQNDGLTWDSFRNWFKKPIIGGAIIHFTDLRY